MLLICTAPFILTLLFYHFNTKCLNNKLHNCFSNIAHWYNGVLLRINWISFNCSVFVVTPCIYGNIDRFHKLAIPKNKFHKMHKVLVNKTSSCNKKIISLMRVQPGVLLKCVNVGSPAWGCCLSFAYFFPNFSLALLIKVLLIKRKACNRQRNYNR